MRTALFKFAAPAIAMALAAPAALAQVSAPTGPVGEPPRPVRSLTVQGVLDLLGRVANILVAFVAIISVIMVIWGGFRYATSGGEETKVGEARKTITYGIIGLAVALLAFAVIAFVNNLVGGTVY